ncbi:hypothetical protein CROQUDRAFT_670324 [Cronartium quercuum f. sp. fusiforme G11]|uniref:N-acetyltransferase domain-containing protein n=1 Tax=Cronartium quercuum f. sp. fusiforme G11 TaxID=708437 RepID=A0A9P6NLF9_9BASI|nr:hypothetical protein CROQUDRAFT_670324 [Cronartium quercuum f. sp. fusiforme G11]
MTVRKMVQSVSSTSKVVLVDLTPNNVGTVRKINSVLFPVRYSEKFYAEILHESLADFCKLIYFNDLPVGAVCCRVETDPTSVPTYGSSVTPDHMPEGKLYIMTLGVLAPYRRHGLATKLLNHVIQEALKSQEAPPPPPPPKPEPTPAPSVETKKTLQKGKKTAGSKAQEATKQPSKEAPPPIEEEERTQLPKLTSVYVHVQHGNEDAKAFYLRHGFELEGEVKDYYRKVEPRDAWIFSRRIIKSSEA